jgi:hypothetical protein
MARAATGQHASALNLIIGDEPLPFFHLIEILRRPFHVENLVARSDEALRLAMTLNAPFHVERRYLICERHQVNSSVTRRAADSFIHVNAVIEIDEVGKIVDTRPFDRLARAPALTNRFEVRAIGPDLRVAVHASLRRRNARVSELLDRRVTITAIDSIIADVMLVTELNGLLPRKISLSVVRGSIELEKQPDDYGDEEDRAENADF